MPTSSTRSRSSGRSRNGSARHSSRRSPRRRSRRFAEAGVDAAVVEAGLGGRLDATNVLDTRVVLLTNVSLEHTDVLGETLDADRPREARGREGRLRRRPPGRDVRAAGRRARDQVRRGAQGGGGVRRSRDRGRRAGRAPGPPRGTARRRSGTVRTIRTVFASSSSACPPSTSPSWSRSSPTRTPRRCSRSCDAPARASWRPTSSSARALPAAELARLARPHFDHVEVVEPPASALERGHELGEPVLVTGSLYLLGDLAQAEQER